MPAIAPIALVIGAATETYAPTSFDGKRTTFTDTSTGILANWRQVRVDVRPAAQGNTGHLVDVLLVRPNPVGDQANCCVDKDNAPASTVNIKTLLHKTSTAAQADELVDMIRKYVATTAFADLVKGASYY